MGGRMAAVKVPRLVIGIVGVLIAGGSIASVFLIEWGSPESPEPPPIRPIKFVVVGTELPTAERLYPGRVDAAQRVDLAFQVSGPIIELPVLKGQEVNAGDLIARIDPRDFQNDVDAATARLTDASNRLALIIRARDAGGANETEVISAQATLDVATAELAIMQKALDDTVLRAPFAGRIANVVVDNFQNVQAKDPIVSLQDISSVEILVNVPESRVVEHRQALDTLSFVATFDYLPGREFGISLQEFATEADPDTQTYAVTFSMPAPTDVTIFPGMTATVAIRRPRPPAQGDEFFLPIEIVPVDGVGVYFVWRLEDAGDGTWMARRTDVEVGAIMGETILVARGISQGDRLAAAGVHLLADGQQVRLLDAQAGSGS